MSGSAADTTPPPGRVVAGRYRLDGEIGRGGMGVVWRATDTLIERTVAIKELRAPSGPGAAEGDAGSYAERAMQEARHAGRIDHPAVVAVHDVIAPGPDDDAYLAPECFDTGQTGPAADLWALGATLFHAVAGRAPFDRDTTTATLRAILFEELPNRRASPASPR